MRRETLKYRRTFWLPAALAVVVGVMLGACGKVYTPEPQVRTFELPEGTELYVSPTEPLQLDEVLPGELFTGILSSPLVMDGIVIAPRGAPAAGEFVIEPTTGVAGAQPVGVKLTKLTIHGGEEAELETTPIFPQEGALSDDIAHLAEDTELMFVLRKPAEVSWSMDLDPSESAAM